MKIMICPLNGARNISEFVYGGEVIDMPDPNNCSNDEWADYVFFSDNNIGVVREWWLHAASSFWFIAERHTGTDEIVRTYKTSDIFKERVEFAPKDSEAKS
jgi:sarcosine oxidase subunit delta